jgi:CheY-like chemotaxis protein
VKTILLIDDSKLLRRANERALTRAGYSVVTAGDGEEALRVASEQPPDLIFLDMLLPKLGGPQVLRSLKKNSVTAGVPVVVLSSLPKSNERQLKKEGAAAYFDKSSLRLDQNADSIVDVVRKILGPEPLAVFSNQPESDLASCAGGKG